MYSAGLVEQTIECFFFGRCAMYPGTFLLSHVWRPHGVRSSDLQGTEGRCAGGRSRGGARATNPYLCRRVLCRHQSTILVFSVCPQHPQPANPHFRQPQTQGDGPSPSLHQIRWRIQPSRGSSFLICWQPCPTPSPPSSTSASMPSSTSVSRTSSSALTTSRLS